LIDRGVRAADPTGDHDTAPPPAAYSGTRATCQPDSRTGSPALPFCDVHLKGKIRYRRNPNYPSALNTLGDHLQKRRLELGLTWKAVAALIGQGQRMLE